MARIFLKAIAILALAWAGAAAAGQQGQPRILFMGDSLLAAHAISGRAVSDATAETLGEPVRDRSVVGARILYRLPISGALGLNIGKQYRAGPWQWVVLNGGGNDLWLGCGCARCARRMDKLISADGTGGRIPALVARLRATGARVIWLGYLRSPGVNSPIEECRDEGDELEARLAAMAARDPGTYFLSLADLVPYGDRSYHMADMIHPSLKASREIGRMVARLIRAAEQ